MNIDLPDAPRLRDKLAAACLLLLVFVALAAGFWIGATQAPVTEDTSPAPEHRQRDGSLVLQRAPAVTPAPHLIPRGTAEVRRITATLQPRHPGCEPITVTTSIIQDGDGLRAVTSATDATVIAGNDAPIRPLNLAPPPRVWAAGIAYEPLQDRAGAWVHRDIGRLRIGAELKQREDRQGIEPWLLVGLTFGR